MRSGKRIISVLAAVVLMMLPTGCDFMRITEDLSDCGTLFSVKYNVTLRTNLTTQVQTVLRSRFENEVADLLEDSLKTWTSRSIPARSAASMTAISWTPDRPHTAWSCP